VQSVGFVTVVSRESPGATPLAQFAWAWTLTVTDAALAASNESVNEKPLAASKW